MLSRLDFSIENLKLLDNTNGLIIYTIRAAFRVMHLIAYQLALNYFGIAAVTIDILKWRLTSFKPTTYYQVWFDFRTEVSTFHFINLNQTQIKAPASQPK